jgi:hypothetical protein
VWFGDFVFAGQKFKFHPTNNPTIQPGQIWSPALGRGVSGSLAKILALVVRGLMLTPTQKSYPKHADGQ